MSNTDLAQGSPIRPGDHEAQRGGGDEVGEQTLRPLDTYEKFRVVLHDLGYHYNVSVAGLYSAPVASCLDSKSVRHAMLSSVRKAILEHPCLSLQVRRNTEGNLHFVRLHRINAAEVVEFRQAECQTLHKSDGILRVLEDTLSKQNSTPFRDAAKPLWRTIVMDLTQSSSEEPGQPRHLAVLFVYHHVIADGKSGLAFHNTILHWLNHFNVAEARTDLVTIVPEKPLLPSMDELVKYRVTWKAWIFSKIRSITPCMRTEARLKKWSGSPYHNTSTKTNIRLIQMDAMTTRLISQKCRDLGISVTALLQVLVGTLLFETFEQAELLQCGTAISLRRFFPQRMGIDNQKMGLWIDGFGNTFTRTELLGSSLSTDGFSWKQTQACKRHIEAEIRKGTDDLGFASLQGHKVDDFVRQMKILIGRNRSRSYSIVSVGVFEQAFPNVRDDARSAAWKLDRMFISQSAHVNGSAIQFCSVATETGGMTISLNWQEGTVSDRDVSRLVARLEETLSRLGSGL